MHSARDELELWLRTNGAPWLVVRRGRWRRTVSGAAGAAGIVAFALRWFAGALLRSRGALLGVLPLLLVAVVISFFSTEMWQTVGSLHGLPIAIVLALLVILAAAFVSSQAKPDLVALTDFTDGDALRSCLPESIRMREPWRTPPLRRTERANLLFVSALAQVIAAAVVALAVAAFFVIFGVLTVSLPVTEMWIGGSARVLARATLAGHEYVLTSQLLRVSAFLGTFSGFYLIVSSATDPRLRQSVAVGHDEHLRAVLAVRAVYRGLV